MNRKSIYLKLLSVLLCTTLLYSCKTSTTATSTPTSTTTVKNITTAISELVTYDTNDYYTQWKNETPNYIALTGTGATLKGSGATIANSKITITAAGVYVISGNLDNGQIIVDVKDKGTVKLVLNGTEINCSNNAPIYVLSAEKTIISLEAGTENLISDGAKYVFSDATTDEPNAAIYSKDDLTINGSGKLTVRGKYNNGITSKDDLKITGGDIKIYSADDGLMGKDIVAVKAGTITIEAGGDGIKASNDTDAVKGSVALEGGTYNIKSKADGIQANTAVLISGGTFTISSGGGSAKAIAKAGDNMGNPWGAKENDATAKTDTTANVTVAETTTKTDATVKTDTVTSTAKTDTETETVSAKGIKASTNISIGGGTFKIDSSDDALHSSKNLTVTAGDISIKTGDDAVHADESLIVKDGKINITKSYEGLESNIITIAGGEIHIISKDDGINAAEGTTDASTAKAAPGQSAGTSKLNINGGYITVDASGDGLDSNGSISMTSGTVVVSGPTTNGNGALDYDGKFEISGGLLMSAGSSGMAQATSEESSQFSVIMNYTEMQKAGTAVHLKDSKGNTVGTFTPKKDYQSVVVSSSKLIKGGTYTLYSGGTTAGESPASYTGGEYKGGTKVVEFTIVSSVTWLTETGATTAKTSNQGGPGSQGNPGERGAQKDPTAMKTAYSTVLKALVTAKTITKAQADKVLIAVTENMQVGGGGTRPDAKAQVDGEKPETTAGPGETRPKNDSLSELVTIKVITQAQADIINQKFQEARR